MSLVVYVPFRHDRSKNWGDRFARLRSRVRADGQQGELRPQSSTLGDATLAWLGVVPGPEVEYVAREVDDLLADRLGGDGALLVVTGPPLAGVTRTVARAARRMLGGHVVVAPGAVSSVDVEGLLGVCEPESVLWLDGAPLGVLDQVTHGLVARARASRVRIVVTTRPELALADHPNPATTAILRQATVGVGPLSEAEAAGTPYRPGRLVGREVLPGYAAAAFVDPVGWSSLLPFTVAAVAAAWEVLAVPPPLTPDRLAALAPGLLTRLGVPRASEDELRDVIRRCARGPQVGTPVLIAARRDGAPHLRAHPLVLDAAVVGNVSFARALGDVLDTDAVRLVARTALARGDEVTALELLRDRPAGGLAPRYAARVATRAVDRTSAIAWYREALGTHDLVLLGDVRVRLGALLRTATAVDRAEARELLTAASPDQRALLELGELDLSSGRRDEARARWVAAAAGPDPAAAVDAAWRAAVLDLDDGRDDDAVPLLQHAFLGRGAPRNGRAGLALARLHRRRGEDGQAEIVLRALVDGVGQWAPDEVDPREEAVFQLGRLAEDRGNDAGAARYYAGVSDDPEATCRLAECHLRAGRPSLALAALDGVPDGDGSLLTERWDGDAPDIAAWQAWIAAEVAMAQGRLAEARTRLAAARGAPGARGRRAGLRRPRSPSGSVTPSAPTGW